MDPVSLLVVSLGVLALGFVSRRIETTSITAPMLFAAFGFLAGPYCFAIFDFESNAAATHLVLELTLILVLFSDASRISVRELRKGYSIPARMLVVGMPLTIVLGALLARPLFPEFGWMELALLAAVLTPTDAALGQVVVSSNVVPVRIRQTLNVESGLNDGIAVPIVLALLVAAGGMGHGEGEGMSFAASQILLGPVAGIIVAWPAAKLLRLASDKSYINEVYEEFAGVAIALAAFAAAELMGGNGFIAAFVAGFVVGNSSASPVCKRLHEFAEGEGQLLALIAFLLFGAVLLPDALGSLTWQVGLYIVLSLTVVRMLPVAISLLGSGLRPRSVGFLGWFGPRGLATILFALLVAEATTIPQHTLIFHVAILAVAASTLLHGATAAPLARSYGRWVENLRETDPTGAECLPAPELPVRISMKEKA